MSEKDQLDELQKKYEEMLKELKEAKIRSNRFEGAYKAAQKELNELKFRAELPQRISLGFINLDNAITSLGVLKGEANKLDAGVRSLCIDKLQKVVNDLEKIREALFDEFTIVDGERE